MDYDITLTRKQNNFIMVLFKTIYLARKRQPKLVYKVGYFFFCVIPCLLHLILTISSDLASHPIVTRGVLLDWYSYALDKNLLHSPFTNQNIPLYQLLEVAQEQKVRFRRGDILLIRTGWTAAYNKLTDAEKIDLGGRENRASCGVEATGDAIRWHWECGFAAVATDTVAYEAWPSTKPWGVNMHEVSLFEGFFREKYKSI